MDKCCRTCKWFRSGICEHEDMMIKREELGEIISDIFEDVKMDATESYLMEVVQSFENVILSRIDDVNFTPSNISEFYCEHYE